MPCLKPFLVKDACFKGTWNRTPLGLETATPDQPRAALAVEGAGKTLELSASKVPALHREAERDTTGSISRQHSVHTWNGGCVQGKHRAGVAVRQHSALFARGTLRSD